MLVISLYKTIVMWVQVSSYKCFKF